MAVTKNIYEVKLVRGPYVRLSPHEGAAKTERDLTKLAAFTDRPLAVDLFCGAGGLSLGLKTAGFEVILGVDTDVDALATHRAYHPGLTADWDLAEDDVIERVARLVQRLRVTLVAGGPPCQPFSAAGRSMLREQVRRGARGHDQRRDLWQSFLRVIALSKPPAVLMENVPEMALDRDMMILRTIVDELEHLGYSVEERVLDSSRFGVPQFRHRLILVALRDRLTFRWPRESSEMLSVDNAIGDLPIVEGGWRPSNGTEADPVASGWARYEGPVTDFQRLARAGVADEDQGKVFDHITRPVREDDAVVFSLMDSKTRYSDLDAEHKRYRDDIFDDKYKRLDGSDLSRTITAHIAKDGYGFIHPWQDRTLTVREAARLQTFPDWFRFDGPPSSAFRQIGNAVPPKLGEELGRAIIEGLTTRTRATQSTSRVSRALSEWYHVQDDFGLPWLSATNRWVVIQWMILWDRIGWDLVPQAWASIRNLTTPEETLAALPILRRVARRFKREPRCDLLFTSSEWFRDRPELLCTSALAADLVQAPNVTQSIADVTVRVIPATYEDPVIANFGVLRVAARFHGEPVDRQNRLSDGRLAIARMIGGDDCSHAAHLALVELANSVCTPLAPDCPKCPLRRWCSEATIRRS
jgi:DNA (cytosine-5)-methyltransferase 1